MYSAISDSRNSSATITFGTDLERSAAGTSNAANADEHEKIAIIPARKTAISFFTLSFSLLMKINYYELYNSPIQQSFSTPVILTFVISPKAQLPLTVTGV